MNYRIFSLGDNALTIEFGSEISVETNEKVLRAARLFDENSFKGFVETVPAYGSLTVFYEAPIVRRNYPEFSTAFAAVKNFAEKAICSFSVYETPDFRKIEIPVCFDGDFAPDLKFIAAENNLPVKSVKKIFLGKPYRVFMLGFLPGFAYMGELDERIAAPRKSAPRTSVAAGSVGIAGRQTGIYSLDSPGGWQIIGQTPLRLFTPNKFPPTLLQAGDEVKFYEISRREFIEIKNRTA